MAIPQQSQLFIPTAQGSGGNGGGLRSSAIWHHPQQPDVFKRLRAKWISRILDTKIFQVILTAFHSETPTIPLTDDQLQPFLHDMKDALEVNDLRWAQCLHIHEGQAFRLELWRMLLEAVRDPRQHFIEDLKHGVRLGVHADIPASPL